MRALKKNLTIIFSINESEKAKSRVVFEQSEKSNEAFLFWGAIAQLVARLHGMQEVTSSTLVSSTIPSACYSVQTFLISVVKLATKLSFQLFIF